MIFVLAIGALGMGMVLILIIARYAPHPNETIRATQRVIGGGRPIPYDDFRALLIDLFDALKLDIVLITGHPWGFDFILRSTGPLTGGRLLVTAVWEAPGDLVDQPWLLRLQEDAKADAAAKGILITPYTIVAEGLTYIELPLELIDGRALKDMVEKYLSGERMTALAQYRGFGM